MFKRGVIAGLLSAIIFSLSPFLTASATEVITPPPEEHEQIIEAAKGQQLRLLLKRGERTLYVVQGDLVRHSFPVAVGKPGYETPPGIFHVREMRLDPVWRHPFKRNVMIDPYSKNRANPLGSRVIIFWEDDENFIGFHGTPEVESIGSAVSLGCVRLREEDIRRLWDVILPYAPQGIPVEVE